MKSQSFSLLVESIKDNNLDSLLQVLVHAKIPILSKKIKRAVIVIEAGKMDYRFFPYSGFYQEIAERVSQRLDCEVSERSVKYYLDLA